MRAADALQEVLPGTPSRARFSKSDVQLLGPSDPLDEVEAFRYQIYIAEQGKPYPEADHVRRRLPDEHDQDAFHFILGGSQRIVGYFRVHLTLPKCAMAMLDKSLGLSLAQDIAFMSRLMLDRELRGSNAAVALLQAAYEFGLERGARVALSHCRPALVPLYERLGLRKTGSPVFLPLIGLQMPMLLRLRDYAHLRSVRSPLLLCIPRKSAFPRPVMVACMHPMKARENVYA